MTSRGPDEAAWFEAIGHPHRVAVMRRLLTMGTATPTDLAGMLGLPLGTLSYHVRFLAKLGILRLTGRTQRRGASVHHYQLADRERVASVLWGMDAALLVTDFERDNGRGDATVTVDPEALAELRTLTAAYLARVGELGLQTRERHRADDAQPPELTQVAVLLATDEGGERVRPAWT
jgi:DNA-binding transcriptional ArsR family regulator